MSELTNELRKLAHAPTIAPPSVYANACGSAYREIERLEAEIEPLRAWQRTEREQLLAALNDAAYALFEIKRMQPAAIKEHAAAAHEKVCAVIDGAGWPRPVEGPEPVVNGNSNL